MQLSDNKNDCLDALEQTYRYDIVKKLFDFIRQRLKKPSEYTNPEDFKSYLFNQNFDNKTLLLMSSGNYGGLDFDEVRNLF